jgi:hypothetical protein
MSDLIRKQFYISRRQESMLKKKAAEMGVAEAQIVREALDNQLDRIYITRTSGLEWQEELEFIKQRIADHGTQEERNRTWKRDDLYDR